MNRLETIVIQYSITIKTPTVIRNGERAFAPTPFTLFFQNQSLQGTQHTQHTITPTEALTTLFILIDAARTDSSFRRISNRKERQLKQFLGAQYEAFLQAFLEDKQEQYERQKIAQKAAFDAVPKGDELIFSIGERVRFLGDGDGGHPKDWIYAIVIDEVWQQDHFVGILVRREKDNLIWTMRPESLYKKNRWTQ